MAIVEDALVMTWPADWAHSSVYKSPHMQIDRCGCANSGAVVIQKELGKVGLLERIGHQPSPALPNPNQHPVEN